MQLAKRIVFFLAINLLVFFSCSLVLALLEPYLHVYGFQLHSLLIFSLVWGMGGALLSLSLSRLMAKWLMGVKILDPNSKEPSHIDLLNRVYALAKAAKLPVMPQVGIFESLEPNAFATGPSKRRALVAVSRGLLNKMSPDEIDGVIAHEISHIANGDMITMTLIQGIINAFVMFLARILAFLLSVSGSGRSKESRSSESVNPFLYMMLVQLFQFVFMIFGWMGIAFFSRKREFRADHGGAQLAGKEKMVAALRSLLAMQNQGKEPKVAQHQAAFQSLQISTHKKRGFLRLFSTHPPLEERIARLEERKEQTASF